MSAPGQDGPLEDACHGSDALQHPATYRYSRRSVLLRAGISGVLSAVGGCAHTARPAAARAIVDVHHHVYPPGYVRALVDAGLLLAEYDWSPEKSIEDMDKAGVATSMTSFTPPHTSFLDEARSVRLCREMNEFAASLRRDYPGRFGAFAILPVPHLDKCLQEIAYACDSLNVDGVGLLTSYDGRWLGHPDFAPLFEELNRRKAKVFVHPTITNCCADLVTGHPANLSVALDIGADTTRTIASLIFSGASQRYADIDFIFCHGGGTLTSVAERLQVQMVAMPFFSDRFTREIVDGELQRFFYDTAQISNTVTVRSLADLVPPSQILFGTDYPVRSAEEHVAGLSARFDEWTLRAIYSENALRLFPRLQG